MATAQASEIEYLKTLRAVRERSRIVLEAAKAGKLHNFNYDAGRMKDAAELVASVISRDYGPDKYADIPPHGRWQQFNIGGVSRLENLIDEWRAANIESLEITRRLIDLFFVSVLLDAGAGNEWSFLEPGSDVSRGRSEGIAVASLYMFKAGAFSSGAVGSESSADGHALSKLTEETFNKYFQVRPGNVIVGGASRIGVIQSFGKSLLSNTEIFGETGRPGNVVDYLIKGANGGTILDYETLWDILQRVLLPAWPANRLRINDIPLGDAWPLQVLKDQPSATPTSIIQPFHKLTQWLGYSLTVPFTRILHLSWKNIELGTGLPEYRNGGLFVDMGVLTLKTDILKEGIEASGESLPIFPSTGDVIVEWRALTVALLDELHKLVNTSFAAQGVSLTMAQFLEAGTWFSGRELAAKYRPETRSSPILIDGDGTLF